MLYKRLLKKHLQHQALESSHFIIQHLSSHPDSAAAPHRRIASPVADECMDGSNRTRNVEKMPLRNPPQDGPLLAINGVMGPLKWPYKWVTDGNWGYNL